MLNSQDNGGPQELTLNEAVTTAMKLHQAGRFDDARTLYERILEVAPEHADVCHFLGVLHFQQGDSTRAIELVRRAVELVPDHADALNNLGNIYKELDRLDDAAGAYRETIRLNPDFAPAHNNLGIVQNANDDLAPAEASFRRAIELDPKLAGAYDNLCRLLVRRGKIKEAHEFATRWNEIVDNDPVAQHTLAALTGDNVPDRCSDDYVRQVFDSFAVHYDSVLARLENQGPQLMADALADLWESPPGEFDVLDAGCGTGLCAPILRSYARSLVGVDLSQGMLDRVPSGSYDRLVQAELTEFLARQTEQFDLIVSSDTLNYFGDLEAVLRAAAGALRSQGVLVATIEHAESVDADRGFDLQEHGRYRHSQSYLQNALDRLGFRDVNIQLVTMRKEMGEPVGGMLFTARKI